METFIQRPSRERREAFEIAAAQLGITEAAVEKDFWVCWVLKHLFDDPQLKSQCLFKGGTSLSKCFQLIQRFSEDIDLVLDWTVLPEASRQPPWEERSKTQQEKLNKALNVSAQQYIATFIMPRLERVIAPQCRLEIDAEDSHTINIHYPALFAAGYLRPVVRLEIGPLAAKVPAAYYQLTPYVVQQLPGIFGKTAISVMAIKPERSFWEKATILHAEAHRPKTTASPKRYARHYYDLYCMADSPLKKTALKHIQWLADVVAFKQRFYPSGWANYQTAQPPSLRLLPSMERINTLEKDYANMASMLFGEIPTWKQIIEGLDELEATINQSPVIHQQTTQ